VGVLTAVRWPLGALLLGAAGLVWLVPGFCWLALTCCQWGRDFRQQVNQVPPLGGVERRQEGVGCAGERGGRLALRAPGR